MRRYLLTLLICTVGTAKAEDLSRPKILLIVADDMGWADVGYHDSAIKTPHIDRLAREGGRARPVLRRADVHAYTRSAVDRALLEPLR